MSAGTRRSFLLLAVGAIVAAVLAPGAAGAPQPVVVGDSFFDPNNVAKKVGTGRIVWDWNGVSPGPTEQHHNVVHEGGLFRSALKDSGTFTKIPSAGTFRYYCEPHRFKGMKGELEIRLKKSRPLADGNFRIVWAVDDSNTGDEYDVRFRIGDGSWRVWKDNYKKLSAVFGRNESPVKLNPAKTYDIRARSQKSANRVKRSGWSPILTVSP